MPICGDDDKLKGMLTDRDIAVRGVAQGMDPAQTSVDDSAEQVVEAMADNQVRRVPVLDAERRLVGIVSQADVAISNSPDQVGKLVEAISTG